MKTIKLLEKISDKDKRALINSIMILPPHEMIKDGKKCTVYGKPTEYYVLENTKENQLEVFKYGENMEVEKELEKAATKQVQEILQ